MKETMQKMITKDELKFWLGIIAVIVSVLMSYNAMATDIALVKDDVATLVADNKEKNDTDSDQDITIAKIVQKIGL